MVRTSAGEIASEIERIFEAKVKPETIKSRILRAGSNEPQPPTPENDTQNGGDSGDKLTPQEVVKEVEGRVGRK